MESQEERIMATFQPYTNEMRKPDTDNIVRKSPVGRTLLIYMDYRQETRSQCLCLYP